MIAEVLDYNGQIGVAVLSLPEIPAECFYPSIDMLEDGIWMSCWDLDDLTSDKNNWLVFELVGDEWIRVTCEKTLNWYNFKTCVGEIEYKVV